MKRLISLVACILFVGVAAVLAGRLAPSCRATLRLIDAQTGEILPGVARIVGADGRSFEFKAAVNGSTNSPLPRGQGLQDKPAIDRWTVLTSEVQLQLPQERITFEAFSGLDTELAQLTVDLAGRDVAQIELRLHRFYDAAAKGMRSANTHLHLMKLSREQADRYLAEVPRADGLDLLFVSYLERAEADRDYISNSYSKSDLEKLSIAAGTLFGNGEEHRHNFAAQGEGYGHVMLLDIPQLILPVSIGPGITKTGTDGTPLQRGIDQARRDQATVIWCHNDLGMERIANLVTGRLDAQNIFDGSPRGSYKDTFYRGLDIGLKVPFSTGTDWFIYDLSRTYAKVEEPLTARSWLRALAQGKSYITNGPFLEFEVNGKCPGELVQLNQPGTVSIVARGFGRLAFQRIEVIHNGRVVRSQSCRQNAEHFVAELRFELPVDAPGWLALRIPPPPVKDDSELREAVPVNEYGQSLFAHTSAIAIEIGGRTRFDRDVALQLQTDLRNNLRTISQSAQFADDTERARVVDVYQDALSELDRRLGDHRVK